MCSGGFRVEDSALLIDISSIEKLIKLISWLAAPSHVGSDVVQVAEPSRELDVCAVVHPRVAKDTESILSHPFL